MTKNRSTPAGAEQEILERARLAAEERRPSRSRHAASARRSPRPRAEPGSISASASRASSPRSGRSQTSITSTRYGPLRGKPARDRLVELVHRVDALARHAHAARQRDEIEIGAREVEHVERLAADILRADVRKLVAQDRVGAVVEASRVVTLRFSRACVHSDWIVYIALPSAWMLSTGRSGHATAAPVASGMPMPIEPPMFCSQVCGCALRVEGKKPRPVETPSSTTMAFSGISAPSDCASVAASILPVAGAGGAYFAGSIGCCVAPSSSASHSSAWTMSSSIRRQRGELRVLRRQQARLVRIGEERHRHAAADQHDVLHAFQRLQRLIDRIGNALDRTRAPRRAPCGG